MFLAEINLGKKQETANNPDTKKTHRRGEIPYSMSSNLFF